MRKSKFCSAIRLWGYTYRLFNADRRRFLKYGLPTAKLRGEFGYALMLSCHSIEKGLCYPSPRYFGESKIRAILSILKSHSSKLSDYEIELGRETIDAWLLFCEANGFGGGSGMQSHARNYLKDIGYVRPLMQEMAGAAVFGSSPADIDVANFDKVIFSRKSMRRYAEGGVSREVFERCARHFLAAPSACNRQMCKLYWVRSEKGRCVLQDTLMGLSGFDVERASFFVVTYDLASLPGPAERNQGYLNAGLAAMNFCNALHANGIGSTFLQWANGEKDSALLRSACSIPCAETIAVVLAAGPYPSDVQIPASKRRPLEDIVRVVD